MKRTPSPAAPPRRVERTLVEHRGDTAIQVRVIEYGPALSPVRPQRRTVLPQA